MSAPAGTRLVTVAEDPSVLDRWEAVTAGAWPEYNLYGDVAVRMWRRLFEEFPAFQFMLLDAAGERLGVGQAIPFVWDGTVEGLPEGIDAVIERGFADRDMGRRPTALSALMAVVAPEHRERGTSTEILRALLRLSRRNGFDDLVAPVRPNRKHEYPLIPIERYAGWKRSDGLPFDPWLRVHARLGGKILRSAPRSMRITATVEQWEKWTGMRFPESGEFVFPAGLAAVRIDLEAGRGEYFEPNVWMHHRVPAAGA